jgi:hypothetical protein
VTVGLAADDYQAARRPRQDEVMRLGPPVQIAYAVPDVHAAARQWSSERGAGPFFVLEHIAVVDVRHRGQPSTFDHSSAYGQWGPVMVELVQDHTVGPSPVADVVGHGGTGLHHTAHFVDDLESAQRELIGHGWAEALFARTSTGTGFAFHDALGELGHMIEIYEGTSRLRAFYAMVARAAEEWDGTDPVRRLG